MSGLNICTRCLAISARLKRLISSSLLPENIGPTTTSIQPMFPFTMSTLSSPDFRLAHTLAKTQRSACSQGVEYRRRKLHITLSNTALEMLRIDLAVKERREGIDERSLKSVLARDQVVRKDSPRPLRVAYSMAAGEGVHRFR